MNSAGITILSFVILAVTFMPRRWALLGMMAGVLYLTQGQKILIFGLTFYAIRFVEIAGFIRILRMREFDFSQLNRIDKSFLLLNGYTTFVFLMRSSYGQFNQIGVMTDYCLCYFIFRAFVRDIDEFRWFLRAFVVLLVPYVALLMIERMTGTSVFAAMGTLESGEWKREGMRRCQGSFRHPSLLGTLGASFLPLYIGLGFLPADRKRAVIGAALCLMIVWASNSGGPLNCASIGLLGWMFWRFRGKMRFVRRALAMGTITLALLMHAPIWYLPARVSTISGGDGWHRSYLMDVAFHNFDKWWFAGMSIHETVDWFPYLITVVGGADITNLFIAYALDGGVAALGLFILLLILVFKQLGKALAAVRWHCPAWLCTEPFLWGLGVMLAAHMVNWLGITYFDQFYVIWILQLAAISSLTEYCISAYREDPNDTTDDLDLVEKEDYATSTLEFQ